MRSLSFIIFVYNSLLLPVRLPRVLSCETLQASKTTLFSRQMSSSTSSPATTTVERDGTYESGSASVAFVTTPDEATAKKIAEDIVEKELAACVNIIPSITSIYKWEGKINEDSEVLLMIKTRTSRIDDLAKYVRDHHPYSVAEVISLPIENGNIPYLDWISRTVRSS